VKKYSNKGVYGNSRELRSASPLLMHRSLDGFAMFGNYPETTAVCATSPNQFYSNPRSGFDRDLYKNSGTLFEALGRYITLVSTFQFFNIAVSS
jgi:hypothetical protein